MKNNKKILWLCLWLIPPLLLIVAYLKAPPTDRMIVYSLQHWDCSTAPLASKAWCHFRMSTIPDQLLAIVWTIINGLTTIYGTLFTSIILGIFMVRRLILVQKIIGVSAFISYWILFIIWITEPYKIYSLFHPQTFLLGFIEIFITISPISSFLIILSIKNVSNRKQVLYTIFTSLTLLLAIFLNGLFLFLPYT